MTQVSVDPAEPSGSVRQPGRPGTRDAVADGRAQAAAGPAGGIESARSPALAGRTGLIEPAPPAAPTPRRPIEPNGPIEWLMSTVIRKLAWSSLSVPKVAVAVSGLGLLLGMLVGAAAPNSETLLWVRLPLTNLVAHLLHHPLTKPIPGLHDIITGATLYSGDILACLGLAGMLWAHSQGWRPNPRRLLLVSTGIVAIMVCLTPVGSSDTASYAAYGRIAALGGNPYTASPLRWLGPHSAYISVIGYQWKSQLSVYGPVATWVQSFAAWIGGSSVATTIWVLMILNGLVFLGVGLLLLKTSDDPIRATLFWTANPVLIQQLVGGGHFDTFVAAAAIGAIQVARKVRNVWGDLLVGLLIGVGCGIKISMVLVALGLAWPLLRRREWMRLTTIAVVAMATVAVEYSFFGIDALKPLFQGSQWVTLPSPWWFLKATGDGLHVSKGTLALLISCLWLVAMFVVAWFVYRRISSDQPPEVVAPFALTYAWILAAPWMFAWYTALPWVALTQVPRNRMTRWLAIVTVVLALWHSSGGWVPPGRV